METEENRSKYRIKAHHHPNSSFFLLFFSFMRFFAQFPQIGQEFFGHNNLVRSNDHFPCLLCPCDFIGGTHFRKGHSANNENDQPWPRAHLGIALILVPLTVASTGRSPSKQQIYLNLYSIFPFSHR